MTIEESHINTHTTTVYIQSQLSLLDVYMMLIGSIMERFNLHIKTQLKQLSSGGKITFDLLSNLFKGYKAARDQKFVEYIKTKEEY